MAQVIRARNVYAATGKAVWPWETDAIPVDYMDAMQALAVEYPRALDALRKQQQEYGR